MYEYEHKWAQQNGYIHEDELEREEEMVEKAAETQLELFRLKSSVRQFLYCLTNENAMRSCTSHTRKDMLLQSLNEICEQLGQKAPAEFFNDQIEKVG